MKDHPPPQPEDEIRESKEKITIDPIPTQQPDLIVENRDPVSRNGCCACVFPEEDVSEERITEPNEDRNITELVKEDIDSKVEKLDSEKNDDTFENENIIPYHSEKTGKLENGLLVGINRVAEEDGSKVSDDVCAFASMDNIMENIVNDQGVMNGIPMCQEASFSSPTSPEISGKDDAEAEAIGKVDEKVGDKVNAFEAIGEKVDEAVGDKVNVELMTMPLIDNDLSNNSEDNNRPTGQLKNDENYASSKEEDAQEVEVERRKVPTGFLECDYDKNPTHLYTLIQQKQYDSAIHLILSNSNGNDDDLFDCVPESVLQDINTWVVRYERDGETLRWKMLCLHAAVFFKGPVRLIELLIKISPFALEERNDQGMLPLHLAFKYHGEIEVIEQIMNAYPQGIHTQDCKGRTPLQCYTRSKSTINSSIAKDVAEMIQEEKYFWENFTDCAVDAERELILREVKIRYQDQLNQVEKQHIQKVKSVEDLLEQARKEATSCRNACYNLISKNEESLANEEKFVSEIHQLRDENLKYVKSLDISAKNISALDQQVEEMAAKVEETKTNYNALEKEFLVIDKLKKSKELETQKCETLEKTNALLRKTIADLKGSSKELEEERDRCRRTAGSMLAWKAKAEQLVTSSKALQDKLKQMTVSYRSISQDKQESDLKANNLSLANEVLQHNLDDMTEECNREKKEKMKLQSEFKRMDESLKQKQAELDDSESKMFQGFEEFDKIRKELHEKISKLTLKLHREEELNVSLKKTIASFIKIVESNVCEAEEKIQEMVNDPELNCLSKQGKGSVASRRHKIASTLERRIMFAEEKLQMILDMQNPQVETLPMAKDFISTHLEQLTTEYEIISYERDLWKLKSEDAQDKIDKLNDEKHITKNVLGLGDFNCSWLCGV